MASTSYCANHVVKQHRDGREAWCHTCGFNLKGMPPVDKASAPATKRTTLPETRDPKNKLTTHTL